MVTGHTFPFDSDSLGGMNSVGASSSSPMPSVDLSLPLIVVCDRCLKPERLQAGDASTRRNGDRNRSALGRFAMPLDARRRPRHSRPRTGRRLYPQLPHAFAFRCRLFWTPTSLSAISVSCHGASARLTLEVEISEPLLAGPSGRT